MHGRGTTGSGEVRTQHPRGLFLLTDVVAHEGVGALVVRLVAQGEDAALPNEKHAIRGGTVANRFDAVGDVLHGWNGGAGHVVLHGVKGLATQGEDALGDLVNLELEVGVELFEFEVEFEEVLALDVPMEAAHVLVKDVEVAEQGVELLAEGGAVFGVQADGKVGVHDAVVGQDQYALAKRTRRALGTPVLMQVPGAVSPS